MTVVTYTYDAWGRQLSCTGSMASTIGALNPLRYRGYIYDQETNLYYLQSRYYNPTLGRFINADGLVSTGQGLLGNNMFAYCNNNPIMFVDPSGYFLERIIDSIKQMIDKIKSMSGENAPADYIEDNSKNHNCYSYAFGLSSIIDPGNWTAAFENNSNKRLYREKLVYTVDELAARVISDMNYLGKAVRLIDSPLDATEGEYVVALMTSNMIHPTLGVADYHFAVLLEDGTWADKPGRSPSRWNKIDGTARYWDYDGEIYISNYYNSETRYFAVGRT